jgi:hypothetical protein
MITCKQKERMTAMSEDQSTVHDTNAVEDEEGRRNDYVRQKTKMMIFREERERLTQKGRQDLRCN